MSLSESALPDRSLQDSASEDVYDDGYLRVEHHNYYLVCAGESIFLPRTEFVLISRLVRSIERVVPAEELWRCAWGDDKPFNSESLHVHIYRLRTKLTPYRIRIETLVGVGYRLILPSK